jgi:hypothetical protein
MWTTEEQNAECAEHERLLLSAFLAASAFLVRFVVLSS